jgi:hypothetical protein
VLSVPVKQRTPASLQTPVVLQALACVTLPYHRTANFALELAHSTGCRIRADRCILRAPAVLRGAEAGVGAAGGECFVLIVLQARAARWRHVRRGGEQSEHDGLVLGGACVCTVLSHLVGPLPLARWAVGCMRTALSTLWRKGALGIAPPAALPRCAACCTTAHAASGRLAHAIRCGRHADGAPMPASDNRVACHHSPSAACAARTSRSAASGFAEPVGAHALRVDVRCAVTRRRSSFMCLIGSSRRRRACRPSPEHSIAAVADVHHLRAERVVVWAVIAPTLGANQRYGRNLGDGRLRKKNGLAVKQATLASGRRSKEPASGDIAMRCLFRTGVR